MSLCFLICRFVLKAREIEDRRCDMGLWELSMSVETSPLGLQLRTKSFKLFCLSCGAVTLPF
jgi:hypothetical protein